MTGRGIDQIQKHPGDPQLYEAWARSALEYLDLAEKKNGPIPRGVGPDYIWGDALGALDEAAPELRIINLETAVTDRGDPSPDKGIHYRMHPENLGSITAAEIDCCVLANNHTFDWSLPGLMQTLDSLEEVGLIGVGAGNDAAESEAPAVIDVPDGPRIVIIALGMSSSGIPGSWAAGTGRPGVAFSRTLSSAEMDSVAARVATVASPGDLVVVSIHWGPNWGYQVPASHRRFARALIDRAGVHLVHGHSSHHPMGMEVYRGRLIVYGCGDLINDYEGIRGHDDYRPDLGLLYLATMDPAEGHLLRLELVPVRRERFRLALASTEERDWLRATLSRKGEPMGTSIDLTGEGRLFLRWWRRSGPRRALTGPRTASS